MNNLRTIQKQGGFTLIELMIVIAIVAILMAIAIPAYQDYTVRARMSETVAAIAPAKLAVSETSSSIGGGLASVTTANAGYTFPGQTSYVNNVAIADGGVITASSRNTGAGTECVFTVTPNDVGSGQLNWECEASACDMKYVPAECRP